MSGWKGQALCFLIDTFKTFCFFTAPETWFYFIFLSSSAVGRSSVVALSEFTDYAKNKWSVLFNYNIKRTQDPRPPITHVYRVMFYVLRDIYDKNVLEK